MNINTSYTPLKVVGYFSLSVKNSAGVVTEKGTSRPVDNVVTKKGAFLLLSGALTFYNLTAKVGTSTTERTVNSTSLGTPLAATATVSISGNERDSEVDNGDGTSTVDIVRTGSFSIGQIVGTISELGIHDGAELIAGQLIKDEFGNPTTLTLLSDEQLAVTYTVSITVPNGGLATAPIVGSGTVTSPRGSHTYNIYAQPFFYTYADIGGSTPFVRLDQCKDAVVFSGSNGLALRTVGGGNSSSPNTVDNLDGTFSTTFSTQTVSPNLWQEADIKFMVFGPFSTSTSASQINTTTKYLTSNTISNGIFVVEFSPALEKTDTESLVVGLTGNYSTV